MKIKALIVLGLMGICSLTYADGSLAPLPEGSNQPNQQGSQQVNAINRPLIKQIGGRLLLDGYVEVSKGLQLDQYDEFVSISTPTTPGSRHARLWLNNTTKQLCTIFDNGTASCLANSGSSGISTITAGYGLTGGGSGSTVAVSLSTPIAAGDVSTVVALGVSTAAIAASTGTLSTSTTSLQNQVNLDLTSSSATATYLQQSSATATYLQLSSATATYLKIKDATTTYLTLSSATATYLQGSSATATYLQLSSATANYLKINDATTTYLTLSSATATYLQTSSATATYLQLSSATATYVHQVTAGLGLTGGGTAGNLTIGLSTPVPSAYLDSAIGVSTAALSVSTASLQTQINSLNTSTSTIATSTASLQTQINNINTSTAAIAASTTTLSVSTVSLQSQINTLSASTGTASNLFNYRRPSLNFKSITSIVIDSGIVTGTSGDTSILYPDGSLRTTSSTGTAYTILYTTQVASLSGAGKQSGLTVGTTSQGWWAVYSCKATDSNIDNVIIATQTLPITGNYTTLNNYCGKNGWIYLGLIRIGDNATHTTNILSFIQNGNYTVFTNSIDASANTEGIGIETLGSSSASSLTLSYVQGVASTQFPNNMGIVDWQGVVDANNGFLEDSSTSKVFADEAGIGALSGGGQFLARIPATMGVAISQSGTTNLFVNMLGFTDKALGIGSNPLF